MRLLKYMGVVPYMTVEKLFRELSELPQVEAIALGGSRATGRHDEKSDYDVYVYLTAAIDPAVREAVLGKYCQYMEIGNSFWELEDDVTLKDGIDMDIIYRNLPDFADGVKSVVTECNAWNGYTTCMWHNLITSRIVFDRNGRLSALQKEYQIPYPEKLKRNIISNNMHLLSGMLPSFDMQIKKAIRRNDLVSVNHRVAEFLASYFDVIFALNEMTHPGEKRMQSICSHECRILPKNFDENLNRLFAGMFREDVSSVIDDIVMELQETVCGCVLE